MELWVLDNLLRPVAVIDEFESLIWTDRYSSCGDFELYAPVSSDLINKMPNGCFVVNPESEHAMIVESTTIATDLETGTHITKEGRSLEALLERRIFWSQTDLVGNLQSEIKRIITENIINPSDPNRAIPNFIFVDSTDPAITSLEIESQISSGGNLLETIQGICEERGLGFKLIINENRQLEFSLYSGVDRSYRQTSNSFVVFSPEYDNLKNSNYKESIANRKTVGLAAGPGEEDDRLSRIFGDLSITGIDRVEVFVDASDVSYENEYGVPMEDRDYIPVLEQKSMERLQEYAVEKAFEGEADPTITFVYGRDFYLGDIVQLANEYGTGQASRIEEIIFSQDESGIHTVPTFIGLVDTVYSTIRIDGHVPAGGISGVKPIPNETIDNIVV